MQTAMERLASNHGIQTAFGNPEWNGVGGLLAIALTRGLKDYPSLYIDLVRKRGAPPGGDAREARTGLARLIGFIDSHVPCLGGVIDIDPLAVAEVLSACGGERWVPSSINLEACSHPPLAAVIERNRKAVAHLLERGLTAPHLEGSLISAFMAFFPLRHDACIMAAHCAGSEDQRFPASSFRRSSLEGLVRKHCPGFSDQRLRFRYLVARAIEERVGERLQPPELNVRRR